MNQTGGQEAWEATYQQLKGRIVPNLEFNQTLYENVIARHVDSDAVWLDAGCGHHLFPEWRGPVESEVINRAQFVCGADADLKALRMHRSIKPLVLCDLSLLPFKSESFTLITCNMVAEHLEHPSSVFCEFARVLRVGGKVIVHTPHRWSYFALISFLVPQPIKNRFAKTLDGRLSEDYYPVRYRCNTKRQLRRLFHGVGLKEVRSSMFSSDAAFQFLANSRLGNVILLMELYLLKLSLRSGWGFLRPSICVVYKKLSYEEE